MDWMCRYNILTHIQGFGAEDDMDQDKEELTVYLCHELADLSSMATMATTMTITGMDDEEKGWGVDGCCDPCVPYCISLRIC